MRYCRCSSNYVTILKLGWCFVYGQQAADSMTPLKILFKKWIITHLKVKLGSYQALPFSFSTFNIDIKYQYIILSDLSPFVNEDNKYNYGWQIDGKTRGFLETRDSHIQCRNVNYSSVLYCTLHLLLFRGCDSDAWTKGSYPVFQQWMLTLENDCWFLFESLPLNATFSSFFSSFRTKFV